MPLRPWLLLLLVPAACAGVRERVRAELQPPRTAPPAIASGKAVRDARETSWSAARAAWGALEVLELGASELDASDLDASEDGLDDSDVPIWELSDPEPLVVPSQLHLSIARGRSTHSRHLDSLQGDAPREPVVDEEGYGVEMWYRWPASASQPGIGLGLRGVFAEADPFSIEGLVLSLSFRL